MGDSVIGPRTERLRIQYARLKRVLNDGNVRIGLFILFLGGSIALSMLLVFPEEAPSTLIAVLSSATASFAGAYLSYTVVVRHFSSTEQERIDRPGDVVDRYLEDVDLLLTETVSTLGPATVPDRLPISVVDRLDEPDETLYSDVVVSDEMYEFPPSIAGFFEPFRTDLRNRFETEGKFNSRKARVDRIDDTRLHVSETTYFRSFCTTSPPTSPSLTAVRPSERRSAPSFCPTESHPSATRPSRTISAVADSW